MTETYRLYHSETCGFCHRVRRYLTAAGWEIPLADTLRDPGARAELIRGGGRATVPCLRIDREDGAVWLYESLDIIAYLEERRPEGS
jgi:glutathione S-transferase